ncbi:MAG: hypothetical protein ACRD5I_09540 [Candidatus Acidiferrales bacterium]
MTTASTHPRLGRSIGAVLAGFFAIAVLSLGTDQVFHTLQVYPPWDQPMRDSGLLLLALAYRIVYAVAGCYLAARLAPRNPMRHALVLGAIGLVLSTAGAVATIPMDLGPAWYPIALVLTALPCAWLGGALHGARRAEGR